jgi:hypothetical protein
VDGCCWWVGWWYPAQIDRGIRGGCGWDALKLDALVLGYGICCFLPPDQCDAVLTGRCIVLFNSVLQLRPFRS